MKIHNFLKKSLIFILVLSMMMCSICVSAKENMPYANISKTVSQTFDKTIYCAEIGQNIGVRFTVTGYYTCDRASGEIKTAYKCTVGNVIMTRSPGTGPEESWNICLNSYNGNTSVTSNGSTATFTASISLGLEYRFGNVPLKNYNLPMQYATVKAYAQ